MSDRVKELREAIDDAVDDSRLRKTALKLAVNHLSKGRYSTNPKTITDLASAFHTFLKGGR